MITTPMTPAGVLATTPVRAQDTSVLRRVVDGAVHVDATGPLTVGLPAGAPSSTPDQGSPSRGTPV